MTQAMRHWLVLLALIAISPMVYAWVQGFISGFLLPFLSYFKLSNGLLITAVIITANLLGSFIVFLLLAFPLGYLTKDKHMLFGVLLGVGLVSILFILALFEGGFHSWYLVFITAAQYAGILMSAVVAAKMGFQVRASRVVAIA
jgi:hypothetical protein